MPFPTGYQNFPDVFLTKENKGPVIRLIDPRPRDPDVCVLKVDTKTGFITINIDWFFCYGNSEKDGKPTCPLEIAYASLEGKEMCNRNAISFPKTDEKLAPMTIECCRSGNFLMVFPETEPEFHVVLAQLFGSYDNRFVKEAVSNFWK